MKDTVSTWAYGTSLPAELYVSEEVFRDDLDWLLKSQWFLTGHISQIPNAGDFFLYAIGNESVIVTRNKEGEVKAFHNACRHRGSRVCLENEGYKRLFTCPYHSWSYDLDGQLRAAASMPEGFDKSANGLLPINVGVFEGLIFVNFAAEMDAPDFTTFTQRFAPLMHGQGLAQTKVAARKTYPTNANWKLVVDNFFECYHCSTAHPSYCQVHDKMKLLAFGAVDRSDDPEMADHRKWLAEWEAEAEAKGYPTGMFHDDATSAYFQAANRLPIAKGALTESMDGQPIAPLMGDLAEFDGGQTGCVFSPLSTVLVNNDHAVIFLFIPKDTQETTVEAIWLVAPDAEEGTDYDPQTLMHLWDTTLKEDKTITENNQLGVASRGYRPGVLSDREVWIAEFGKWYLEQRGLI
ncbi:aromatic ring-hydroxylating dioxygenase subunit alpha [Yoonia sp. SS1-5]|uniref:Aromatic ring-hydroxylating dioxygenase subunit alpha n=1 Tax=Yoonia rhodophyticola TaxID=3137370 RepID=A0AAN0NH54_9RHOB